MELTKQYIIIPTSVPTMMYPSHIHTGPPAYRMSAQKSLSSSRDPLTTKADPLPRNNPEPFVPAMAIIETTRGFYTVIRYVPYLATRLYLPSPALSQTPLRGWPRAHPSDTLVYAHHLRQDERCRTLAGWISMFLSI